MARASRGTQTAETLAAEARVESLVELTLARTPGAWGELWTLLQARLESLLRSPRFLGALSQSEDDVRTAVVLVMEALEKNGYLRLQQFAAARAANPKLRFGPWLAVLARYVALDHLRAQAEYIDNRYRGKAGEWVQRVTLPSESKLPLRKRANTDIATARQMLRFARDALKPEQLSALELWIQGFDSGEIARRLKLSEARAAERLVRAALERLRRRFKEDG